MPSRREVLVAGAAVIAGASPLLTGCRLFGGGANASGARLTSVGLAGPLSMARQAADAGGEHIEGSVGRCLMPEKPDQDFKTKLAEARNAPLPVIACNSFVPGRLKSVGPDADHAGVLSWATIVFERAQRVGVGTIVFGSGGSRRVPNGFSPDRAADQFGELLKRMAPLAQRHNIVVAVEPLRPQEVNFINHLSEGAAIVRRVDHPAIRLTADLYHMGHAGDRPGAIRDAGPLIAHTHIAENKGRSTPGVHGEDFRPLFTALKASGYVGPMSIEGKWKPAELARGFAVVREQWAGA